MSVEKPAHIRSPGDPRPLPTNIKRIGRINPNRGEAVKPADRPVPVAPEWLDADAAAVWRRLAPCLAPEWQSRYEDSLAVYAVLMAAFQKNPASFLAPQIAQLRGLGAALGLTPRAYIAMRSEGGKR